MNSTPEHHYETLLEALTRDGRVALSINEAVKALGICRTSVWHLMKRGQLHPTKIGNRVLIPASEIARIAAYGTTD